MNDEYKDINIMIKEVGVPNTFPNIVVMKACLSLFLHYICIERIQREPLLLDEVRITLATLSNSDNYDHYFTENWSAILNDKALL